MKKKFLLLFFPILFFFGIGMLYSPQLKALTQSIDAINFKPPVDSTRFITLYDADTHQRGEWNAGFYIDYAHNPLELGAPPGSRRVGTVDDTIVFDLIGSYGITSWFEAGARIPVVFLNNYQGLVDPLNPGIQNNASKDISLGDISVDFKFRLLHKKYGGIALIPFVTVPTGKSSTFMGTGQVGGGGKLAFQVDPHRRVRLGLNAGYVTKPNVTIAGTNINDMVLLGAALNVIPHDRFDIILEGQTATVANNFFQNKIQTPTEADAAFRFHATKNIDVTAGGGAGFTIGVGTPDYRAFLGMNYTYHTPEKVIPRAPKIVAKKITIDQMIHFDFNKYNIKTDSYGILNDVASVLKANPQIKKMSIEGHTDWIGSEAYNMKLSQRRADSVRDYLIKEGIDPTRLASVGYGKTRPIADNKTAAGRAQNRRTEFNVVEQ